MNSTIELQRHAPECQYIDEEEEEVFFGPRRSKETKGKNSKHLRRKTLAPYPDAQSPFDAWFDSESDMLILYELLGEFYDEEFDKLSYEEKKALKDKVRVSVPKTPEELLQLYPEDNDSSLLSNASLHAAPAQEEMLEAASNNVQCSLEDSTQSFVQIEKELLELYPDDDLLSNASLHAAPAQEEVLEATSNNVQCSLEDSTQSYVQIEKELLELYPDDDGDLHSNASLHGDDEEENEHFIQSSSSFSSFQPGNHSDKFSDWFEPIEELILFDILGSIDYREIFEAMSLDEKRELRARVDATEPKSGEEILAMLDKDEFSDEVLPSPESDPTTGSDEVIKKKEKSRRLTLIAQDHPEKRTPSKRQRQRWVKKPFAFKTPQNYLRPTSASAQKGYSPRGADPRCPSSPPGSSPKVQQQQPTRLPTGIDLSKVISPVAKYIHSSPAPPLIRNIKSSSTNVRLLSSSESKENEAPPCTMIPRVVTFAQLPEATYKASSLVREQEVREVSPQKAFKACFPSSESVVEPKIFRHLGRVKVPKSHEAIDLLSQEVRDAAANPSTPFKMTLKSNLRESSALGGSFTNESMIDMSLHEVKAVQKLSDLKI